MGSSHDEKKADSYFLFCVTFRDLVGKTPDDAKLDRECWIAISDLHSIERTW
jgi:hypothetical protein